MKTGSLGKGSVLVVVVLIVLTSISVLGSVQAASITYERPTLKSQTFLGGTNGITTGESFDPLDIPPLEHAYAGKISQALRDRLQINPNEHMGVIVYTTDPTELGQLLRENGVQTNVGTSISGWSGIRPIAIELTLLVIPKIAYLESVQAVTSNSPPDPPKNTNLDILGGNGAPSGGGIGPGPTTHLATQGHSANDAWAAGYTGQGIRVAIMDSGVDFANPDLLGTWAVEQNTTSPYFGWPLAFDPYSMYMYMNYGLTYPTNTFSWYIDTSFNATADVNNLLPMFDGRQFNVSGVPSASGYYHLGKHPAPTLNTRFGRSPGILVIDSSSPFVYDSVLVDLNDNGRFGDDKPANISSPISYADYRNATDGSYNTTAWDWGDGMPDISGGLLYFISDGVNPIPYSDIIALRYGMSTLTPGNAETIALMIGDQAVVAGDHGTLCASAVVAQNRTGAVTGFAPNATVVPIGNIYRGGYWLDSYLFAIEGYDGLPDTGDEAMIGSASYGASWTFNDGWDYESRWIDFLSSFFQDTSFVIATGNGGPGFGTAVSPGGSSSVISAGASTNYYFGAKSPWENGTTWNFGDVQPWSNRGPSALGRPAPSVVTVGAWASGDMAVNRVSESETNGTNSWGLWGGTSLATPATAGVLALLYDAYRQSNPNYPTNIQARRLLMNGADNIHYDSLIMGAGLSNAFRSSQLAANKDGILVSPSQWTPGDYRGTTYSSFANIVYQGISLSTTFQIRNQNPTTPRLVNISDAVLSKTGQWSVDFWSNNSEESPPNFTHPDYLWNVSTIVPPGTHLVRGIVYTNHSSFDLDNNYLADNSYRVLFYNWKDLNSNGIFWNDSNSNGVVNSGELDNSSGTEFMRFTFGYNNANIINAFVHDPDSRVEDGLLLGIQHRLRNASMPSTMVHVVLEFYQLTDSTWITEDKTQVNLPGSGSNSFTATLLIPSNAEVGVYSAMIIVNSDGKDTVIPIVINVAGNSQNINFVADPSNSSYYDNGRVYGGHDWSWRPESGDWRYYFMEIPDAAPVTNGTRLLVHTSWSRTPTDIDTYILGPTPDDFSNSLPSIFGPYTLDVKGSSTITNIGGGVWIFNTTTGGPEEWVSAPATKGLHEIALHNVLYAGEGPSETFTGGSGFVTVNPYPWSEQIPISFGSKTFDFTSTIDIPEGIDVKAYGVSKPTYYSSPITQDDRINFFVNTTDVGLVDVSLTSSFSVDLDLYLYYNVPGIGDILVGSSTSPSANERIKLPLPPDGAYRVEVHGYSVPMPGAGFDLTIDIREGSALMPSNVPLGPILAGVPYQFQVQYTVPDIEDDYYGVVYIGPKSAPSVIELPVLLMGRDISPPTINLQSPTPSTTYKTANVPVISASYDDVHGAFYSGVDVDKVRIAVDGRDVTSSARVTATHIWWNLTFLLEEGQHSADIQISDLARTPNQNQMSFVFSIDDTAPIIVLTSPAASLTNSPLVDVSGYTDPDVTLVYVNGIPTATSGGAFSRIIILMEGLNVITVEASDPVGNTAYLFKDITLDTRPPILTVTSPSQGDILKDRSVLVSGITEPGVQLVINGVNAAVDNLGGFSVRIALQEGNNGIVVTATDAATNQASAVIALTVDTIPPSLKLSSPTEVYTRNTTITVAGQTESTATLTVNGNPVTVAGDGSFSTQLTYVTDGLKTISVNSTDVAGNSVTATKTITIDTVAPPLAVTRPPPFALEVFTPSVEVTGLTEPGATVTVSGQVVLVQADGSFGTVVPVLMPGANTITVTATDKAGNTISVDRTVIFTPPNLQEMLDNITDLQGQVQNLTALLNLLNNQLDNANNNITALEERLNRLNQNLTRTQDEIRATRADVDSLSNVLLMGMALFIVLLFVGLAGMYFALGRKIDSLRGPVSDLEELEELAEEGEEEAEEMEPGELEEDELFEEDQEDEED